MYVVLILFVYFYLLVPLISIPCIVKMYVCIAPVTHLAVAGCIFEETVETVTTHACQFLRINSHRDLQA